MEINSSNVTFSVPPHSWQQFRNELLAMRHSRDEVIGFFFCTRHQLPSGQLRLLPRTWVVPSRECYEVQSIGGLELRQDFHQYLVNTYVRKGLDVVHIHTHPGTAAPDFSGVDDHHEAKYAAFLSQIRTRPFLVSGVFDERMEKSAFRGWTAGSPEPSLKVTFNNSWLHTHTTTTGLNDDHVRFDRQRVFGRGVQEDLGQMTVGLVGCGGLGAVFAEQLARLGVRRWVLVDPDCVDVTNLNRMPFAAPSAADRATPKVRHVKQLIRRAWPANSSIQMLRAQVDEPRAERPLASCDLIVVATDNNYSRMVAQRIALRYVRPLLSLGTLISTSEQDGVEKLYCRVTLPPLDGGWCLMCGGIIDVVAAATESAPDEIATIIKDAGYVPDVTAPAVYWLNGVCASLGSEIVHGGLSGFLDISNGLDWTLELRNGAWFRLSYEHNPHCLYCSCEGEWAEGKHKSGRSRQRRLNFIGSRKANES